MKKNSKRILLLLLSALTCLCLGTLAACKDKKNSSDTPPANKAYSVQVSMPDGVPTPVGKVVLTHGQTVHKADVNESGVATFNVPGYEYDVSFEGLPTGFGPAQTYKTSGGDLAVALKVATESSFRSGNGEMYNRYDGGYGTYRITINSAEEELFLSFDPDSTGTFAIFSTGNVDVLMNGYAATAHTCFPNHNKDTDNRSENNLNFYHQFEADSVYYNEEFRETVGVQARSESYPVTFHVSFIKLSDYFTPPVVYERVEVNTEETLSAFPDRPSDKKLLEANYDATIVYNETDRFYHVDSVDGPVLLVKLTTNPSRLFSNENPANAATFQTINAESAAVFYMTATKDDGTKYYKDYTKLIQQVYPEYVNSDGVYGVTKELKQFLYEYVVLHKNSVNIDASVAEENRWLAPCYYYGYELGTENNPIRITKQGRYDVAIKRGGAPTYYQIDMQGSFDVFSVGESGKKGKIVYLNGTDEVAVGSGEGFNVTLNVGEGGLPFRLTSYDAKIAIYQFIVVAEGQTLPPEAGGLVDYSSYDDPYILTATGSVETEVPLVNANEGSDGKLYYQYTATLSGKFTFAVLNNDSPVHVTLENKTANASYHIFTTEPNLEDEGFSGDYQVSTILTFNVAKDDVLMIIINCMVQRESEVENAGGAIINRTKACPITFELSLLSEDAQPTGTAINPYIATATGSYTVSVFKATSSDGAISFDWGSGVWYAVTLTEDATYTIATQQNDVTISLHASPSLSAGNIASTRTEGTKDISASLTAGTTYYLYVNFDVMTGAAQSQDLTFTITKN